MDQAKSETRDGMRIDWDVPITMDDGLVLRADVFRGGARGVVNVIARGRSTHGGCGRRPQQT